MVLDYDVFTNSSNSSNVLDALLSNRKPGLWFIIIFFPYNNLSTQLQVPQIIQISGLQRSREALFRYNKIKPLVCASRILNSISQANHFFFKLSYDGFKFTPNPQETKEW